MKEAAIFTSNVDIFTLLTLRIKLAHSLVKAGAAFRFKVFMKFDPSLAPIQAAVFPLVKKAGMPEKAKEVQVELADAGLRTFYDQKGAIGRRYRRQDEIGTPYCVTIDFETLYTI